VKLIDARFVTSAAAAADIPRDGVPHLALVGRSNVGKSSLINALARNKTLARTSAAPGKTRLANLYRFDVEGGAAGRQRPGGAGRWSVYVADLPGYGYARGGRDSVAGLRAIAEAYFEAGLEARPAFDGAADGGRDFRPGGLIAGVLHLVDARHPGLESDLDAAEWLTTLNVQTAAVATKVDKLSRSERMRNLKALERQLGMAVLPTAAVNGEGLDDLWTLIARLSRR
jgi:GTP-binding protein